MKKRTIIITVPDHARLTDMIAFGNFSPRERAELDGLEEELKRAEIVAPEAVPPDVVTMNSRAELLDLDTGERMWKPRRWRGKRSVRIRRTSARLARLQTSCAQQVERTRRAHFFAST